MRRGDWPALAALAGLLAMAHSPAQSEALRPTAPVKINADRAEWQKGGAMVYTGNVRMESGDLKLAGARLELRQFEDGQFEAQIDGEPAALDHAGLPTDAAKSPVSAQARQLKFNSRSDIVEVLGNALLTRGTDQIRGETIRYDVVQRRIQAAGGEGGQVQIVIQPPPRNGDAGAAPGSRPAMAPLPGRAPAP